MMPYRFIKNMNAMINQLVKNDIYLAVDTGVPTSGSTGTGAGFAGTGSPYINLTTGIAYVNIGTKAIPQWQLGGGTAIAGVGSDQALRLRFTTAQVNAGAPILPAIPGWRYRILDMTMIAIGGAASGATDVRINATQATIAVALLTVAIAALTQSTVVRAGAANAVVLADGASFVQNDVNTPILIAKTGGALATATAIDVIISYQIEQ
jgi:hypothetical protein